MEKLDQIKLNPEEITKDKMVEVLNDLYWQIRNLRPTSLTAEAQDKLSSCLDGAPDGVTGVMLLMSNLKGNSYHIKTFPDGHRDYEKDTPADPKEIYEKANQLIDKVNSLLGEKSKEHQPGEE